MSDSASTPISNRVQLDMHPRAVKTAAPGVPQPLRDIACILLLSITDLAATTLAVGAGFVAHSLLRPLLHLNALAFASWLQVAAVLYAALAIGFMLRGLYLKRAPFWDTLRRTLNTMFIILAMLVTGLYLLRVAHLVPRSLVLLSAVLVLAIVPAFRMAALWLLWKAGLRVHRVVVIGRPDAARSLAADLERDPGLGYRVSAICEVQPGAPPVQPPAGTREVVVAGEGLPAAAIGDLVAALHRKVPRVTVVPELPAFPFAGGMTRFLFDQGRILLTSRNALRSRTNIVLKRVFDLAVTAVLLLPALPLMALIWLLIRLDSKGPAIFAQRRVGRGGRPFLCLKFRTMHVDAEKRLERILERDAGRRVEWERFHKLKDDPRVTRAGRWLRRWSLDELPQLLNVLAGRMSLVGPRPLPKYHYEKFSEPHRSDYLDVLPGITGLWQVSGRSDEDLHGMARLNSWYVRNWSPWLDVTILLRTLPAVLRRRGAY